MSCFSVHGFCVFCEFDFYGVSCSFSPCPRRGWAGFPEFFRRLRGVFPESGNSGDSRQMPRKCPGCLAEPRRRSGADAASVCLHDVRVYVLFHVLFLVDVPKVRRRFGIFGIPPLRRPWESLRALRSARFAGMVKDCLTFRDNKKG